jgi:D-serine deaminase-like pyridoxal phosphate-dependent protein
MPQFAQMQIDAGAIGITVAKVGEAEVMAEGGIQNILIAYPIVGAAKIERLVRLAQRVALTVAVDSLEAAEAISRKSAEAGTMINLLVEIDCGFKRVGIQPGQPALDLALRINELPGVELKGLLTFAGHSYDAANEEELRAIGSDEGATVIRTAELFRKHGLSLDIVSAGSTPSAQYAALVGGITEVRPGTYIFGDLMQVKIGSHKLENCALTVKVTVISRPEQDRAVIDAGTKVFTMDGEDSPLGTGRGWVVGHPGIQVEWFTEEHGMLRLSAEEQGLKVGDTLEIIPVHCCAVINMMDEAAIIRDEAVLGIWPIAGRGKVR